MKIMIATPAYGGQVTTTYCDTLLWLTIISARSIRMSGSSTSSCRSRPALHAQPVCEPGDAGRELYASAVRRCRYGLRAVADRTHDRCRQAGGRRNLPHRRLDLEKFYALANEIADPAVARLVAMDYVDAGSIELVDGAKPDEARSSNDLVIDGPCIRVARPAPASC